MPRVGQKSLKSYFFPPMGKYSILLVDDHQILLDGTKNLLGSLDSVAVKATASTGAEALKQLEKDHFDLLITDFELPDLTGLDLIKAAKKRNSEIKLIVLSMHSEPVLVRDLLAEGINGYVLKQDSSLQLLQAVERVLAGKRYLSDDISEILIQQMNEPIVKNELTPREVEIIRLIAQENSTKQIAELLFISERTVETHRKNIIRKTGVGSLVGLVKYAYDRKLI